MASDGTLALVASVLSVLITATAGILTARSASRTAARTATATSRTDIEKEAFDRAKTYYTDTIDRLERDVTELRADHDEQQRRHETELTETARRHTAELRRFQSLGEAQSKECREEVDVLRRQLTRAEVVLRKLHPGVDLDGPPRMDTPDPDADGT